MNIKSFQRERLINLEWASDIDRKYPVSIKIYAKSSMNLLLEIMNCVSANNMSILSINANSNPNLETVVKLKVMCANIIELEKMIVNMKKIKYVYNIERDNL
jgi:GTP pyrophosphokinase